MVKAYYKNSLEEYKKFGVFHTLRARKWNIVLFSSLFLLLGVCLIVSGVLQGDSRLIVFAIVCFAFVIAFPFFYCFLQIVKINKTVKQNKNFNNTEQFFTFTDDGLSLQIKIGTRGSNYEIPYNQILAAFETKTNFYVYIGRQQALIINKKDITEGDENELCNYLKNGLCKRFVGKRKRKRRE